MRWYLHIVNQRLSPFILLCSSSIALWPSSALSVVDANAGIENFYITYLRSSGNCCFQFPLNNPASCYGFTVSKVSKSWVKWAVKATITIAKNKANFTIDINLFIYYFSSAYKRINHFLRALIQFKFKSLSGTSRSTFKFYDDAPILLRPVRPDLPSTNSAPE